MKSKKKIMCDKQQTPLITRKSLILIHNVYIYSGSYERTMIKKRRKFTKNTSINFNNNLI